MRLISSRALTVLLVVTFVYLRYYELYLTRNVLIAWGDAVETFDDAVKPSGASKVTALAWAPNNTKLAVVTVERVVILFDELGEKRDKFATKPADPNLGKKHYHVTGLAFSPDSTKIVVAQTDNIIFVYKIGDQWGDKKSIVNKIVLESAVTCLIWPTAQSHYVFGLVDGKVRIAGPKGSRSQTLYNSDSCVISLAANTSGQGIISGHADGSIVRYYFDDEGTGLPQGVVCRHSCPPYALGWGQSIVAGGCDCRVVMYGMNGKILQQFDYAKEEGEKEFCCASTSPSGQSIVLGSFDQLRLFNWSPKRESWEEGGLKHIPYLYTITAVSWKRDGAKIVAGTLCGAVELFDCCLKKVMYKNKFEMTYVGLSQVIVKNLNQGSRISLKSHYGYEIERVKIMGHDRYLIAHTSNTLLLGDMSNCRLSEVMWQGSGNEKFYFENENVCMVFNAGELSLVEYGVNKILGTVRTEFTNPHLISVRINERKQQDNKKVAYLVDLHTISIVDLAHDVTIGNIIHDSKINWLELNETGRKLLFRDKKLKLHLYDLEAQSRVSLLNFCSYVQWVPLSDVVVGQNKSNLCVWYNIDTPDRVTIHTIKGDVVDLERTAGKTEVLVQSGVETVGYCLDETMIEFGTAVDDGDHLRALQYLETLEMTADTESMWRTLGGLALHAKNLPVAERCFAALGDVAKARYLRETHELAKQKELETGLPGIDHFQVEVRLAILGKQFKVAEGLLLEHGLIDQALDMYRQLYKWDEAIAVAEASAHPDLATLKETYFQWLLDTGQEEVAGEVREKEGDYLGAVNLYMKGGLPTRAAKLIATHVELSGQHEIMERVALSLVKGGLYSKAGDMYERVRQPQKALESYRNGHAYRQAVELARQSFPNEVVLLEEEWGDHLASQHQYDTAISHYIEAGRTVKAIEAAIQAKQWSKVVQIVDLQEASIASRYYVQIAQHYRAVKNYQLAEKYYLMAEAAQEAVEMYNEAEMMEEAYKIAVSCMSKEELSRVYGARARQLADEGKLREAERLYIAMDQPDPAINLYKKHRQYDHMIRLMAAYHEDLLVETHLHLAKELESEGHWRQAEQHYIDAGDWKAAINMYRAHNLWDDAYRVAKTHGGLNAANQVAYLWAKSLGGESAVKLLTKFGLLEAAVDYATDSFTFDFAFDIARVALKSKLPEIHLKYALYLEDEGKYAEAEEEFIKANKPKEAVLMHVHQQDWNSAQRVAEQHCPDSLADVFVGQARVAFEKKDFQQAETFLLRAERPDLAAKYYKEANMWSDALRLVKEYLPHKLDEFQKEMSSQSGQDVQDLLSQGQSWEQNGEHSRAITTYLSITVQHCSDHELLRKTWSKAVELAVKFVPDKSVDVTALVCDRLANIGCYEEAGKLYMDVDMMKEALDMFMVGNYWDKARHIATNIAPRYEQYVEDAYVDYLKQHNKTEEMRSVDPSSALTMYMESGQWERCLELAEKQGSKVLAKYVALYAAHLIKSNGTMAALQLFTKFGAPANPQNFNIYKRLCVEIFAAQLGGASSYHTYSQLRNLLLGLTQQLEQNPKEAGGAYNEFQRYLLVAHYFAIRAACFVHHQLSSIAAKLTVAMLRYTDIIPVDKAFFEAGQMAKAQGWENMAFVFFNRFLDLSDAIEEGSPDMLDNSDFIDTDIPLEVSLPEKPGISEDKREEVKEWVLAVSMDQRVEQVLPQDERGTYVASLNSPHTGVTSLPCVVSGFPVLRDKIEFRKSGYAANKDDWNRLLMATKTSQSKECVDVQKFLKHWCGGPINPAYSF